MRGLLAEDFATRAAVNYYSLDQWLALDKDIKDNKSLFKGHADAFASVLDAFDAVLARVDRTAWEALHTLWKRAKASAAADNMYAVKRDLGKMSSLLEHSFATHAAVNSYTLDQWLALYEDVVKVNGSLFQKHPVSLENDPNMKTFNAFASVRKAFEGADGIFVRMERALDISADNSASRVDYGRGRDLIKTPAMQQYLAIHSNSDLTVYPDVVVQGGQDLVEMRIKRLDCNKPHHMDKYMGYLRAFARRIKGTKHDPWSFYHSETGSACFSHGFLQEHHGGPAYGIEPTHRFHYVAYIPHSMDVLGWMICEEYSVYDNNFIYIPYTQTVGQFGKVKGVGTELINRLVSYCKTRSTVQPPRDIHFVMFYSGTKTLMKKAVRQKDAPHLGRGAGLYTYAFVPGYPTGEFMERMRMTR
jgi:hypothetical protein